MVFNDAVVAYQVIVMPYQGYLANLGFICEKSIVGMSNLIGMHLKKTSRCFILNGL